MVERRDKPRLRRQEHAVAEDVARHVADADGREGFALDIAIHLAEMPLHGFPGAARRNSHLLVVVTGRAARGECVVEPEIMRLADRVGGVRERRRTLVGGDDEIGVVGVVPHDPLWRHHLLDVEIVGDGEHARDEVDIGIPAGLEDRIACPAGGQPLRIEAALRPDRHDNRVLDLLRLDQAQHLGAVVLRPVGPPEPAPGHRPEAQMNAFDLGAVDEYLAPWPRLGEAGNLA